MLKKGLIYTPAVLRKCFPAGYLGSVRFYKNLILLLVVAAIAVPTGFAIYFGSQLARQQDQPPTVPDSTVDIAALYAETLDYQQIFPDFYAPESYEATVRRSGVAYLTFDSVPSAHTADILDILAQEGVKATFFISGGEDADMLRAIAEAGHTLGMLSWSGDYLSVYASVEAYLTDMEQVYQYIKDTTGTAPTVFRFLGGSINSYNTAIYHQLIAEMLRRGFVPYDWNVTVGQRARQQNADLTVQEMMAPLYQLDRAVITLPDDGTDLAVRLLPGLLDALTDHGYTLTPLDSTIKPVVFAYPRS